MSNRSLSKERLIAKIDDMRGSIKRLSELTLMDKSEFLRNSDLIHVTRSHILIIAEAAISICYHIAAKILKKVPTQYGKCFEILANEGILSHELCNYIKRLIGLRNKMVHRYEEINYGFVYDNIGEMVGYIEQLIKEVLLLVDKSECKEI